MDSLFVFSLLQQLLGQKEYEGNWLVRHRMKQVLCVYLDGFVLDAVVIVGLSSGIPSTGESAQSFCIHVK